jgi:hypothetical protein
VKTISLRKKVAAVAVASLGFGLLSVVPAQAGNIAAALIQSISLAADTTSPEINSAVKIHMGAAVGDATGETDTDTVTFVGYLTSHPAGGFASVTCDESLDGTGDTDAELWELADADNADNGANDVGESCSDDTYTVTMTDASGTNAAGDITASASTGVVEFNFTPTKAGVYTLKVWADIDGDRVIDFNEAQNDISVTVAASAKLSASLSTAYQTITTAAAATSTTDKVPARVVKTLSSTAAAAITVTLKDSAGDAITAADAITLGATVSGDAGGVGATIATAATTTFANQCPGTQPVRVATSITYTDVAQIYFCASNQSGTSTITVTATDADGNITTIGTETISYYGDVASLTVTPVLSIIRSAGGTTGDNTATRIATTSPASMVVTAKDSKGMLVGDLQSSLSVTGTTGIASVACLEDIYDTGTSGAYGLGGEGNYGCTVTSTGAAASGGKDTVQIRIVDPADSTKYIYATTQNVTFGGAPSTVTMAFNKTAYTPGEKGVLTVTVKDSSGNPASDGVYATLFSGASTTNATGSTPAAAVVVIGGKKDHDIFVPNGKGSVNISNTLGATIASKAGTTVSATAEVTDPNAGLLTQIDALNAKIVALNALIAKIMKKLGVK